MTKRDVMLAVRLDADIDASVHLQPSVYEEWKRDAGERTKELVVYSRPPSPAYFSSGRRSLLKAEQAIKERIHEGAVDPLASLSLIDDLRVCDVRQRERWAVVMFAHRLRVASLALSMPLAAVCLLMSFLVDDLGVSCPSSMFLVLGFPLFGVGFAALMALLQGPSYDCDLRY